MLHSNIPQYVITQATIIVDLLHINVLNTGKLCNVAF